MYVQSVTKCIWASTHHLIRGIPYHVCTISDNAPLDIHSLVIHLLMRGVPYHVCVIGDKEPLGVHSLTLPYSATSPACVHVLSSPSVVRTHEVTTLHLGNRLKEVFPFVRKKKRSTFLIEPQQLIPV